MSSDRQLFCDGPGEQPGDECGRPVSGHGKGKCQTHLKQLQRTGKMTPIAEKISLEERAVNAGTAMLEADTDDDYAAKRRSYLVACKALGASDRMISLSDLADELRRRRSLEVLKGLSAARARGARLGRPPRVSDEELRRLFELLKTGRAVARVLNMHWTTVNARLARVRRGKEDSPTKAPHAANRPTASCPRVGGGSPS